MTLYTAIRFSPRSLPFVATCLAALFVFGCQVHNPNHPNYGMQNTPPIYKSMPKELSKVVHPAYVIEPPDVLMIEGIELAPKSPYALKALDVINIDAPGEIEDAPLTGSYTVEPSGLINMGSLYGSVRVVGLTTDEATVEIGKRLEEKLKNPEVNVVLSRFTLSATIDGQYRVGLDGRIQLGTYGSLMVTGMTVPEAKTAVERLLSKKLDKPKVSVSVAGYQSKGYYVILQGAGMGDTVQKLPSTGNETVMDAIANVQGLDPRSSKKIWVSRPGLGSQPKVMPVDWFALTERGSTETNYQLLPGDRVFIAEDNLVALDTQVAKITAPLERIMGFTLLGAGTATRLSGSVRRGGGNPNNAGI